MFRWLRLLVLTGIFVSTSVAFARDPLEVGKSLAKSKFKDWTYGSRPEKRETNCVLFLAATVEEMLGKTLDDKTRDAILISNLRADEQRPEKLAELILAEDRRTKGVQSALVDLGRGDAVEPADAKPGDLIQYWMKPSDGKWFGHAGIIEQVTFENSVPQATLFGAHKSQNGIQTSRFKLRLVGPSDERKVYLVRMR